MAKLKALLLTGGYHGMISQVEGLAKALKVEFHHKIVRLNWLWNYIPPKFLRIDNKKKKGDEFRLSSCCFRIIFSKFFFL